MSPSSIQSYAEHASKVADSAAAEARSFFRSLLGVEFKADESPVTQADKSVETVVRTYLRHHFPEHGIFGEEHGSEVGDGRNLWVIDPIDGTRSFLSGHPCFGFLLGFLMDGVPEIGIIAMPALHETFIGIKGQRARLNGKPIHVSNQTDLAGSILYINEGEKIYRDYPDVFDRLTKAGQTRRFSYDCYPHALLAAGHLDAVIDYDLQPYDYLPVSVVVQAAGGIITDWEGAALTLQSDGEVISAATPELHAAVLALVKG